MKPEVPDQYPETPAWTMFFDGPLYQKYDEFMKGLDFSKILLTSKLKLANSENGDTRSQTTSKHDDWWEGSVDADIDSKIANPNIYSSVSEEYYQNFKDDRERRKRRTRAFIVLALIIMAALAFGTALVIHYFFIPSDEDLSSNVNISISENITGKVLETTSIAVQTKHIVPIVTKNGDMNQFINTFSTSDDKAKKGAKPTRRPKDILTTILTRPSPKMTTAKPTTSSPMVITTPTKLKPTTSFYDLYDFFGMDDHTTTSDDPFYDDSTLASTTEMNMLQTTLGPLTPFSTSSMQSTTSISKTQQFEETTSHLSEPITTELYTSTSKPTISSTVSQTESAATSAVNDTSTVLNKTSIKVSTPTTFIVTNQTLLVRTESTAEITITDSQDSTTNDDISTPVVSTSMDTTTFLQTTTSVEQTTLPENYSKSS